jgi:phage-related protein
MNIQYFTNLDGTSPAENFLADLSPKVRARFVRYLMHLAQSGGRMEGVAFRKLHGYPLEEIRVKESRNLHRVIIKVRLEDRVIVLHGFTKKEGQKTPAKELEIAYQRYQLMVKKP